MGFIYGLIKKLLKCTIYFLLFAAVIVLLPNLPPYTTFTKIEIDVGQPLVGPLGINGVLNNVEKLFTDKLAGPEAFDIYKGEVYTSLATGEIVKLSPGGHVTFVTKFGQPCTGISQEHKCGRPLGFVIEPKKNEMYVADAYYGIWKVDLKTDKKQLLVSPRVEINGRAPKIFNAVALDSRGNLYWTDSSSDFYLHDGGYTFFCDPSGRLLQYDPVKNVSKVLLDKLWLANGVAVSPDNQFVVVAESVTNKVHKYYINGPKQGKSEIFVSGLPGVPDNIRALPDGSGVLVALYNSYDEETPVITRSLAATPHVRKFLARLLRLVEIPFEFLNTQYPHFIFEEIIYNIGHFKTLSGIFKNSGLIQIDWNGNIIATYYNTDGSLNHISDAIVYNDKLYMGSPHLQNFVASVPAPPLLKKAFSSKASEQTVDVRKETPQQAKPTTTTPKPTTTTTTTTTPKPTTTTTPKPTTTTTPKPTTTTTTTPKPTTTTTPKPTTTTPKPTTTTPKPTTTTAKSTTTLKPTAPPVQADKKAATPETQDVPKPSPSAKPEDKASPSKIKASSEKVKSAEKPAVSAKKPADKAAPQQIPIKEEIPSDTIKPNKEKLKVIKKEGPTEIPVVNL